MSQNVYPDGRTAFRLLKSYARRARPDCHYLRVVPNSFEFEVAIDNLAREIDISREFLHGMISAMIADDGEALDKQSQELCYTASLRLADRYLRMRFKTPLCRLERHLGNEERATGIPREELHRFLLSRFNHLHREIMEERRARRKCVA